MVERYCVICHKLIPGYGNRAEPVCEGYCCNQCNLNVVLPARIKEMIDNGDTYTKNSEKQG